MRRSFLFGLLALGLAACATPGLRAPAVSQGDGTQIVVSIQGGADLVLRNGAPGASDCVVTGGPATISTSFNFPAGLDTARIRFSGGGAIAGDSLRVTPGGSDIVVGQRGAPGDESIEIDLTEPVSGPVRRTLVVSFETAPPHTGTLQVTATDFAGNSASVGPFRLVEAADGEGCLTG